MPRLITALTERLHRLKAQGDAGYTLVELLTVVAIVGIIAATVTTGISLGMRTMISVGGVAVSESVAANAVSDITENVTLATPILAISDKRLVTLQDLPGRCERHQYVVGTTLDGTPRNLQHIVQRYRTKPGTDCASLAAAAWKDIPPILNAVVVDNLVPNPDGSAIFRYSAPGVGTILLPGNEKYDPQARQYGPCDVSRVTITISVRPATEDMVQTIRSAASPRAYSLGLRC
jgi:prepilin-type N-terminal cleavage/methylation domain-containing protein